MLIAGYNWMIACAIVFDLILKHLVRTNALTQNNK